MNVSIFWCYIIDGYAGVYYMNGKKNRGIFRSPTYELLLGTILFSLQTLIMEGKSKKKNINIKLIESNIGEVFPLSED